MIKKRIKLVLEGPVEENPPLVVFLRPCANNIIVCAKRRGKNEVWNLLELMPNGKFYRCSSVIDILDFETDCFGRIMEDTTR